MHTYIDKVGELGWGARDLRIRRVLLILIEIDVWRGLRNGIETKRRSTSSAVLGQRPRALRLGDYDLLLLCAVWSTGQVNLLNIFQVNRYIVFFQGRASLQVAKLLRNACNRGESYLLRQSDLWFGRLASGRPLHLQAAPDHPLHFPRRSSFGVGTQISVSD